MFADVKVLSEDSERLKNLDASFFLTRKFFLLSSSVCDSLGSCCNDPGSDICVRCRQLPTSMFGLLNVSIVTSLVGPWGVPNHVSWSAL